MILDSWFIILILIIEYTRLWLSRIVATDHPCVILEAKDGTPHHVLLFNRVQTERNKTPRAHFDADTARAKQFSISEFTTLCKERVVKTECQRPPSQRLLTLVACDLSLSENPKSRQHWGARKNCTAVVSFSSLLNLGSVKRTSRQGNRWYGTTSLLHRHVTMCNTQKTSMVTPRGSWCWGSGPPSESQSTSLPANPCD